jgi:hypothetical protein
VKIEKQNVTRALLRCLALIIVVAIEVSVDELDISDAERITIHAA